MTTLLTSAPALHILSLGWGVQSWGLAALSALGVLPKVDFAVHADTGWERTETLEFAARWTPWLKERGIEVVTVSNLAQSHKMLDGEPDAPTQCIEFPAFTSYPSKSSSGMLNWQCSNRWKIQPIRRWLSAELKRRGLKKTPGVIETWIGFTFDESHRAKPNDVKYITKRYPFLEMLERPWTRGMVIQWLRENDLEVPVKSSCILCPFHSDRLWREMQLADNGDWERACEVDRAIRHKRPGYLCYLHSSRRPLEEHDFTRQLSYW